MATNSQIRWSKDDYKNLRNAVNQFNRKINKLNSEENKLYLPEVVQYKEAKSNITTRSELNRYINSLRRFSKEGAEELYVTKSGVEITKWEKNELSNLQRIATRRIGQELSMIKDQLKDSGNKPQWSQLEDQKAILEGTLKNIKDIENLKGKAFEHEKKILNSQGASDYEMKKAINYKNVWMKEVLPNFKNFKNYNVLVDYVNSMKNPLEFADKISELEKIGDIVLYYPQDSVVDGSKDEKQFNEELIKLGIL